MVVPFPEVGYLNFQHVIERLVCFTHAAIIKHKSS